MRFELTGPFPDLRLSKPLHSTALSIFRMILINHTIETFLDPTIHTRLVSRARAAAGATPSARTSHRMQKLLETYLHYDLHFGLNLTSHHNNSFISWGRWGIIVSSTRPYFPSSVYLPYPLRNLAARVRFELTDSLRHRRVSNPVP